MNRVTPVPSPTAPIPLTPQHTTAPSYWRAHALDPPARTSATPLRSRTSKMGRRRGLVVVPSPHCPEEFKPQQRTLPSGMSPHVKKRPAVMSSHEVLGTTDWKVVELVGGLMPSCPVQFEPEHWTTFVPRR